MPCAKIKKQTKDEMDKALDWLTSEFQTIRTGRATPAILDRVMVEAYGSQMQLKSVASISVPEARMLMIKPFDVSTLKDIEKAIIASDLGAAPNNDGKVIRINMPALSEEQRKKLVLVLKDHAEKSRITIRNARRDGNKDADNALKKDKSITEDAHHQVKDEIQAMIKTYEKKIDDMLEKKSADIMTI